LAQSKRAVSERPRQQSGSAWETTEKSDLQIFPGDAAGIG